jgi:hypothetical protein
MTVTPAETTTTRDRVAHWFPLVGAAVCALASLVLLALILTGHGAH